MSSILILREKDAAARTAARLRGLGFAAIESPALEIVALQPAPAPASIDALIATSAQALPESLNLAHLRDAPFFLVGERAAEAVRARGFRKIAIVAENADALAAALARAFQQPSSFLYLAGRDRKATLERRLSAQGHVVNVVETYEARARESLSEEARKTLERGEIACVLHYSRRSAEIFLKLARKARLETQARRARHLALSEDAAAPLRASGFIVESAARPNESALFALLRPGCAAIEISAGSAPNNPDRE